jgi:hypothetical protein
VHCSHAFSSLILTGIVHDHLSSRPRMLIGVSGSVQCDSMIDLTVFESFSRDREVTLVSYQCHETEVANRTGITVSLSSGSRCILNGVDLNVISGSDSTDRVVIT